MQRKARFWVLAMGLVLIAGMGWHLSRLQLYQSSRVSNGPSHDSAGEFNSTSAVTAVPMTFPPPASPSRPVTRIQGNAPKRTAAEEKISYQLRNTTRSLSEMVRLDTGLLLRNALLDTSLSNRPVIPPHLRAAAEPGAYIVQARAHASDGFQQRIVSYGGKVVAYIPNHAWLARLTAEAAGQLMADTATQAVLPLEPYYKLEPSLLALAVENQPLRDDRLNLLLIPGERDRVAGELEQLGARLFFEETTPFGPLAAVHAPVDSLVALAALPGIQSIEPYRERRLANDLTRTLLGVSTDPKAAAPAGNHLRLTGAGVTVGMSDSGVDAAHPDLAGRVTGVTNDLSGHGTHVAGIIAGSGAQSDTVTGGASGSVNGADFRGMAPAVHIHSLPWLFSVGDTYVQQEAARSNLFILNNSWVYDEAFDYDIHAASFDSVVRDALPGQTGAQPLTIVFAAGDWGYGTSDGLGGTSGSVQSPATGKNVITVGASELLRDITATVTLPDSNGNPSTNRLWDGMTDSNDEVAFFSSRGNVARGLEGDAGRFKPDVLAPGSMVVSCKSSQFDYPSLFTYWNDNTVADLTIPGHSTNLNVVSVPANAISFTILVLTNATSMVPFPFISIMAASNGIPTAADFIGNNAATVAPLTPGALYYSLGNASTFAVNCDVRTIMVLTNDVGNYYTVLSNLNQSLGPWYRYEYGTSMSAAAVSGLLALMQEHFEKNLGVTNASPALRKALLINGARALSGNYTFQTDPLINYQGWGLAHLTNSIPVGMTTNGGPVRFYDQHPTNALTTGASHTRTVEVSPTGRFSDVRMTLVWTDPPGNPLAGVKLVNDLDLVVTNLDTGEVFLGNHFGEDSHYSEALSTNVASVVDLGDRVNNVENVFLQQPLGSRYSVTVVARRVHVNAVSQHPNGIVQDYALVIATANPAVASPFTSVSAPTMVTNAGLIMADWEAAGTQPLYYQRVGANSPLMGGTNGTPSQWTFFVITNRAQGTNVVTTFIPPNLARSRVAEADIDLYVTRDSRLTNLNSSTLATAMRSVGRGGTEYVIITNARPGELYYVGVKAEDQQAGEFILSSFDGGNGGQLDENGNLVLRLGPLEIPDGMPDDPAGASAMAFAMQPMTIQRVIVTNTMTHQNGGDLVGILSHESEYVVLNNHSDFTATQTRIYDDSGQADIAGSWNTDGPGTLQDFLGEEALGMWEFTLTDNALHHTGRLDQLTLVIEPTSTNANYPVYLTRLLGAGGFLDTAINVPADATNLEVCVSATGPVNISVGNDLFTPVTGRGYEYIWTTSGSLCTNINLAGVPPLSAGRYQIHVENPGNTTVRVTVSARVMRDTRANGLITFESNQKVAILDDAVTNSTITVTNIGLVTAVEVGVRIDHPRASDLVLHLVSPTGQRILLTENRGATNALGYGAASGADLIYLGFTEDTNRARIPIKFGLPPFTNMLSTQAMVVDFCGFERPLAQEYGRGSVVEGWTVISNAISIARDTNYAHSGAQLLALSTGNIRRQISTRAGHQYRLTMAYRDPGTVGWWRGDGNMADLINGNTGNPIGSITYGAGEVGQAFSFSSSGNPKIRVTDIADLRMTNSLTIEAWVNVRGRRSNVQVIFFRGNAENDQDPYKIMLNNNGAVRFVIGTPNGAVSQYLVTGATVPLNTWTHVVGTLDNTSGRMSIYLNGTLAAQVVTPTRPYGDLVYGTENGAFIGNHTTLVDYFNGRLDEVTLYQRTLTDAEIHAIYNAGTAGKLDPLTPQANARFELVGFTNQVLLGGKAWQTNTVIFTATSNFTTLNLSGRVLGMVFDTMNVEEVPKDSWYLPEEPLTPLVGQWAAGQWTLEIWDSRAGGAVTNASLVSWHLNLGIAYPGIQPQAVAAGSPQTGALAAGIAAYYRVDIPESGGVATNVLVMADTPVNLVLNEFALPTGETAGDIVLLSQATNGQAVVRAGVQPLTGSSYYLGVIPSAPNQPAGDFRLQVDFGPGEPPKIALLTPLNPEVAADEQGFSLSWTAPRWQRFQVQYCERLDGEWQTIPGIIESPNGQFVFGDDGVLTGSVTHTRFYRLILAP